MEKVHRVIKFTQNAWLKPYIEMNTDLRKKAKDNFQKCFSKIIKMQFFEKLWKMWEKIEILNLPRQKIEDFIVYIKADDIYKVIAEDLETRFDSSNHELDRAFSKGKNKKINWINGRRIRQKNHNKTCWTKI